MVDAVVAAARRSFGDPIADELAAVLLRRTAEANRALDESFAAAERRLDETTSAIAEIEQRILAMVSDAEARQHQAAMIYDEAVADRDVAASLRQEAVELHRIGSGTEAAAQAAMKSLREERATVRAQLAALDAREAELVAWEAELARRSEELDQLLADAESTTDEAEQHPLDDQDSDAQFRMLRSHWRTPADVDAAATPQRGWGRRDRPGDRSEADAR